MGADDVAGARAYSDQQMLAAVASAAGAWQTRLADAGRADAAEDPRTMTAIMVLDFDEIAEIRNALTASRPIDDAATRLSTALVDDLTDWLEASTMTQPAGEWAESSS